MFLYFFSAEIKRGNEQFINPVSKLTEKNGSLPLQLTGKCRGSRGACQDFYAFASFPLFLPHLLTLTISSLTLFISIFLPSF